MRVNLLPQAVRKLGMRRIRVLLCILLGVTIVVYGAAVLWDGHLELVDARKTIGELETEYAGYHDVLALEQELREIEDTLSALEGFLATVAPAAPVSGVLESVRQAISAGAFLEDMSLDGTSLVLTGYSASLSDVASSVLSLQRGDFTSVAVRFPDRFDLTRDRHRIHFIITAQWKAGP